MRECLKVDREFTYGRCLIVPCATTLHYPKSRWLIGGKVKWYCLLKERYGYLDVLDVSIDGVDIPLFLNSFDVFCRKHISLVELVTVMKIKASLY